MPRKTREPWIIVDKLNAGNVEVEGAITSTNYIQFDLTFADGVDEGRLQWNIDDGTLEFGMPGGSVNLQIGQEMLIRAKNDEGAEIPDGTPIYISGALGSVPLVKIASNETFAESAVAGIATEDIASGQHGYINEFGLVRDIDTSGCAAGETVWLHADGVITNVRPEAGADVALMVGLGVCLRSHADEGVLLSNTYIVPRLIGLSDVYAPDALTNGEFMAYDGTNSRFEIVENATFDTDTGDLVANSVTASTGLILTPSVGTAITAVGGITPTNAIMYVEGDGGAVTVTANPQIAAGTRDGEILYIVGMSNTNTITLNDGNGIHLHGQIVLHDHDALQLWWDADDSEWEELSRNNQMILLPGFFASRPGSSGTTYAEGYYEHAGTANDFSPAINFGTANIGYAAHLYLVTGELTVDEVTITITGTSITDAAVRTTSDTEDIVIPDATSADAYYETSKKWLGTVAVETVSGTAKLCDYGWAKYYDNNNNDFTVIGIQVTGRGGANDANANFGLRHHKATGWTYTGTGATPPAYLADWETDHGAESSVGDGLPFSWKRDDLDSVISGNDSEGVLLEVFTSANNAIEQANFVLTYTPK